MNNIRYSANATRMVNRGIASGARPLGKGSRATSYNNLIRTNLTDITEHVENMRFKMARSTHSHGTDKWTLEDNGQAHAHNLQHILHFSSLLHRKNGTMPALPTLVEFIIFLIKHPSQFHSVGSFKIQKKTPSIHNTSPSTTTIIHHHHSLTSTTPSLPTWTDDLHTPNFDDEEDLM